MNDALAWRAHLSFSCSRWTLDDGERIGQRGRDRLRLGRVQGLHVRDAGGGVLLAGIVVVVVDAVDHQTFGDFIVFLPSENLPEKLSMLWNLQDFLARSTKQKYYVKIKSIRKD